MACPVCNSTHPNDHEALACVTAAWTAQRAKLDGLGDRATALTCCEPRFVKRDDKGEPASWTITLNEYQRSNLLWLMCDIAGYDRKETLVPGLQTGDWAGEIPNALRCHEHDSSRYEESAHRPNVSVEDARKWILASVREQARNDALEEAAKLCDTVDTSEDPTFVDSATTTAHQARRIRALRTR